MRYFLDTEFNEDGRTITLISIALVAEDGRELYLVNDEVRKDECNAWVQENMWPHLAIDPENCLDRAGIRLRIEQFIGTDPCPEFWGYFADYDWVVLAVRLKDLVPPEKPEHNALADARWSLAAFAALRLVQTTARAIDPARATTLEFDLATWLISKELASLIDGCSRAHLPGVRGALFELQWRRATDQTVPPAPTPDLTATYAKSEALR